MVVRLRFGGALVVASLSLLLLYKLWVAWPAALGPALAGWLIEAALLWGLWLCAERLSARADWLGRALLYPALYLLLLCSGSHAFYFESAAERRFSLFEVGASGVVYFFAHVLPLSGYLTLLALLVLVHALAFALRTRLSSALLSLRAYAALLACAALGFMLAPRAPSPLVDAVADIWERLRTPSVRALAGPPRFAPARLDRSQSAPSIASLASPFKKVVVLVMETMTSDKLEQERRQLPESSFVNAGRAHAHRYERYFPNNQDSRTGMLGMLGSRFIPYESYSEAGRDHYMYLGERSSLATELRALGFETAFAVSQNELELVVGDLPWQHLIHLDDAKLAAARKQGLLCFVPYEFEHSCEDRALLPEVLAFLDAHERAFLYLEFIWGHASAYNQASGKTNTAYYSSYVDALIAHLRARGTLDETLIVFSSDHGFRDTALQDQLGVYRIPLWFYATRFSERRDDRLFSHLDFKDVLHHERTLGAAPVAESPFVMIVGPTGASLLAVLTRDLDFMLLKLRGDGAAGPGRLPAQAALLHHARFDATGRSLGSGRPGDAPAYLRLFQDYRRGFEAAGGAAR
jgi:Sulfatase